MILSYFMTVDMDLDHLAKQFLLNFFSCHWLLREDLKKMYFGGYKWFEI